MLIAIEFGLYRPQRRRLEAADKQLQSLQTQIAAMNRRRMGDEQILESFGAAGNPEAFERVLGTESGLVYLNRMIDEAGVTRIDFRTEPGSTDGPYQVERFFISVEGSGSRLLEFIRRIESSPKLAWFEQLRFEPEQESTTLVLRARLVIYSFPEGGGS